LTSLPKRSILRLYVYPETKERLELLQGTLDLLILRTLIFAPSMGKGIARAIQETSEKESCSSSMALSIRTPAAWKKRRGWISAKWEFLQTTAGAVLFADGSRPQTTGQRKPISGSD